MSEIFSEKNANDDNPTGDGVSESKGQVEDYGPMRDGIELRPKPTTDPLDPLNFSRMRKWTCLGIVMWLYFLFTYITTTTVPSFTLLQDQYNITLSQVNWTVAIPALGLAVGPLFWSSLADIYGRRPIFIVGTVIALVATIGAAKAANYGGYMAARFFQGFGVGPGATVGMSIVNDLFFEHERGQKLGLWVLAIDMGLLVGPLIGGFVTLVNQFWVEWLTALLFAGLLVAELVFLPETLYPRSLILSQGSTAAAPRNGVGVEKPTTPIDAGTTEIPRTKKLPFFNVRAVPGVNTPKPWDAFVQFLYMWSYPNISISVFFYCFAWYWWVLSIITDIPAAYSQFSPQIQGLLFIGLILGTLISELFFSGTLSDWLMIKLSSPTNPRQPEMRLYTIYPAVTLSATGLILWGISIDKGYHWIVGQVAFFLFAAGIQVGNTAICSYIVDCYPNHAMDVMVFYSVLLNLSAFVDPFFITPWTEGVGYTWCFAAQGIISFFAMIPVTAGLQRYGGRMRDRRGTPGWVSSGAYGS